MVKRKRNPIAWQSFLVVLVHASAFLGLIHFGADPFVPSGLKGDVYKKVGSVNSGSEESKIQVHAQIGGITDARQILAQRQKAKIEAQRQQQEKQRQAQAAAQKAAEQEKVKKKVEQEQEAAKVEVPKNRPALTKVEKPKTEKVEPKAQQAKKNTKENAVKQPAKAKSSATQVQNTAVQTGKTEQNAQEASAATGEQAAQNKAVTKKTKAKKSIDSLFGTPGEGGGDGSQFDNPNAMTKEKYLSRIKAQIDRNFNTPSRSTIGQSCRYDVVIDRQGNLLYPTKLEGYDEICTLALAAIKKTKKVFPPPENIYDEVKNSTFSFRHEQ